jgi:hypothetical protein
MRAGTVLAQAEQRTQLASNNGVTLDAASETLRLLSHAEYLASIGNHDRAFVPSSFSIFWLKAMLTHYLSHPDHDLTSLR